MKRTTVTVTINKSDTYVTLDRRVDTVRLLKLVYFKMINCPLFYQGSPIFPPDFVYLEITGLSESPDHITHPIPTGWTTYMTVPPSQVWSLQYRPVNQADSGAIPSWAALTVEGVQKPSYKVENIRVFHSFRIRLYDREMKLFNFGANTVAQFTFDVSYDDPTTSINNLNPRDRLTLYNRNQQ